MNLTDLQYYQALVKVKNFSQVASDFKVSQPTITMAIQRLEKEFDTKFFIRDHVHKQLHLTPAGRQFAQHVTVILNELAVAHREIAQAQIGKIRFGLPPIIGNYYFAPLMPKLVQTGLLPQLSTVEHGSKEILKMLSQGDLDLALLGSLTALDEPHLNTIELAQYPFKVIVSKDHPLAAQETIDFTALKQEQFIVPAVDFFHEQAFKQISQAAHFRPRVIYRTSDIHVIKTMVAENLGIAYLTSLAITPVDQVKALTVTGPLSQAFHLAIACRQTAILNPNQQKIWDLLVSEQ